MRRCRPENRRSDACPRVDAVDFRLSPKRDGGCRRSLKTHGRLRHATTPTKETSTIGPMGIAVFGLVVVVWTVVVGALGGAITAWTYSAIEIPAENAARGP
jgi:hypothetical protein